MKTPCLTVAAVAVSTLTAFTSKVRSTADSDSFIVIEAFAALKRVTANPCYTTFLFNGGIQHNRGGLTVVNRTATGNTSASPANLTIDDLAVPPLSPVGARQSPGLFRNPFPASKTS